MIADTLESPDSGFNRRADLAENVRLRGVDPEKRMESRGLTGILHNMLQAVAPMLGTFRIGGMTLAADS